MNKFLTTLMASAALFLSSASLYATSEFFEFTKGVGPSNAPQNCQADGSTSIGPGLLEVINVGQQSIELVAWNEFNGDWISIPTAGCTAVGNGNNTSRYRCTTTDQVVDFDPFLDAVLTVGGGDLSLTFTGNNGIVYHTNNAVESCEGSQCDILASLLGPEYSFPCGGLPYTWHLDAVASPF